MGCFDEICAVTRTNIHSGDRIVIGIYYTELGMKPGTKAFRLSKLDKEPIHGIPIYHYNTYDALQWWYAMSSGDFYDATLDLLDKKIGELAYTPDVAEVMAMKADLLMKTDRDNAQFIEHMRQNGFRNRAQYFELLHGIYDDYGWIKEDGRDAPVYHTYFMVHEAVAEQIVLYVRKQYGAEYKDADDPLETMGCLLRFAQWTNIQLFRPNQYAGEQYFSEELLRRQRLLMSMTRDVLIKQGKYLKE